MNGEIKVHDLHGCGEAYLQRRRPGAPVDRPDWLPEDIPLQLLEQSVLSLLEARAQAQREHAHREQLPLPADLSDPREEWVHRLVLRSQD